MKIAVLYTGEIRTIEKTAPFFRKNILDPTNADIFATLQGSLSRPSLETLFTEHWRDNLKSLHWFVREEYNEMQDGLLSRMDIDSQWKHYLKTSGSMVEYYQLHLSFLKMKEYEKANGFQYDLVIRLRTDVAICRPLDLSLFYNPMEIWNQVGNSLSHFMSSIFSLNRISSKDIIEINTNVAVNSISMGIIEKYMKEGNYLMTVRKNVFYVGKRNVFEKIAELGTNYGQWKNVEKYEHWFDAESQLETLCCQSGIDVFDSLSYLEGESLYRYKRENYFDDGGELLDNPSVFCFICRVGEPTVPPTTPSLNC
jgi:hypothetical protein